MERGNCCLCGQHRVLGQHLVGTDKLQVFRCHACIDEHGSGAADARSEKQSSVPVNWWAGLEPPAQLSDVPPGYLVMQRLFVQDKRSWQMVNAVTDAENNYFKGHGARRIWPASIVLAEHLLATTEPEGLRIVELGAGAGVPGVAMASHGALVTLTDVPWMLQLAQFNIDANFTPDDPRRPHVAPLRWGCAVDAAALTALGEPHLVIGADIVYLKEDMDALLSSIAAIGASKAVLAIKQRENIVPHFLARVVALRWSFTIHRSVDEILLLSVVPTPARSVDTVAQPLLQQVAMAPPLSAGRPFGCSAVPACVVAAGTSRVT